MGSHVENRVEGSVENHVESCVENHAGRCVDNIPKFVKNTCGRLCEKPREMHLGGRSKVLWKIM